MEHDGKRERGSSGGGGRFGYDWFLADEDGEVRADAWAKEAVRMAMVNLNAVAAPAGTLPVVLGAGWPGVLLHEAVGHGLTVSASQELNIYREIPTLFLANDLTGNSELCSLFLGADHRTGLNGRQIGRAHV